MAKAGRGSDQFMIRLPEGMRERIKSVAEKNGRSMNAEVVALLEEKFPPPSIDVTLLAEFLDSLVAPFADEESRPDHDKYMKYLNKVLAASGANWSVQSDGFGVISFYPYANPSDEEESNTDEKKGAQD